MKKIFRNIQFLSNIAVIIIALLFGFVVLKQYVFSTDVVANYPIYKNAGNSGPSTPAFPPAPVVAVGKIVPLENVNWMENKKTLVFYISATCHFCKESVPFYQRLIKENIKNGVTLVAVLPQDVNEAKNYLKSENLNITRVYKASFVSIGVSATPTLLLINQDGVVSESWRGKLSPEKETEVLSRLSS